jgi:tetratricopeptide (TPR) repeat protein
MAAKTKYLDLSLIANLWLQIRQSKNFGGISMREQPAFSYDVFISYNSRDRQWVRKELLEKIEEAGLRAFIDFRDFIRGAPSIKEMERGVVECRKILVVLSPNYIGSEWCEIEAIMAQTLSPANRDLRMIPLLKKKCEKPLRIGALTHIDFTEGADFDLAWRQLVAALGGSDVSSKNSIPPEVQASLDQAKAMLDLGQYAKVIPVLRTAVDVADASGNVVAKVKSRCQLGHALAEAYEDFAAAEQQFRDALTFASPEWLELRHMVLHGLGDMLLCGGELDKARATADTSLELAKLSGNAECTADSLLSLGSIDLYCGLHSAAMSRFDEAIHMLLKQSLTISGREVDQNAHTLAACYINKAFAHQEIGELDEALLLYGKAEEQHQIYNNKLHAGKTLLFRGEAHCMNADWKKGIDAYQRALALFVDAANPLWICRCFEKMGQLYAIHQKWKEAIEATFHAIKACEESDNPEELVGLLIFLAQLIKDSDCAIAADDLHPTNLLKRAKELSQARLLRERMADFLVEEARVAPLNDPAVRNRLLGQAIDQLKEKLGETKFSKSRGHLMGFIGELYRKSGDRHQSLSWLKKAGDVFNNSGDILGLARYYLSLGGFYHSEHKLDEAAAAYRTALVTMEGRSSPFLAASIRISFAAALELQRNFSEAQQLLREAQALCIQHRLDNLMPKIAQNFDNIERELQSAQVSSYTLPQLISNLHQLLRFSTKHSVDYLLFWYYAWNTELRALLRSSHQLSLMVVTDDVARFMEFAGTFTHLYDHVLLASCSAPAVDSRREIIPIPLDWGEKGPGSIYFPAIRFGKICRARPL